MYVSQCDQLENDHPHVKKLWGEIPGCEDLATHRFPSANPTECWWQGQPSETFLIPFLCLTMVEPETQTLRKGRRSRN